MCSYLSFRLNVLIRYMQDCYPVSDARCRSLEEGMKILDKHDTP